MANPYGGTGPTGDDGLQPRTGFVVTPSDATDTSLTITKGLLVTVAGNLAVRWVDSAAAVAAFAVTAGQYIPGHFIRVMSTGTTATVIGFGG